MLKRVKSNLLVLALNGVTIGNRTRIAGTTNRSNNRYTIVTILLLWKTEQEFELIDQTGYYCNNRTKQLFCIVTIVVLPF